jgi:sortase A
VLAGLRTYGGHALIFFGLLLGSTLLRSAAGPADALSASGPLAPPRPGAAGTPPALLIASPQQRDRPPAITPPAAVPPLATAPAAATPPATVEPATPASLPASTTTAPAALPATSRIVIPRIGVDSPVVEVGVLPSGEMDTPAFAAGRLTFSAEAGEPGNVVIAGHDDLLGEVFRRLPELQPGDEFVLYRGPAAFRYRVESRTIVREEGASEAQRRENARWMAPTEDATATLISCYPYLVDTHRIIVRGRLVAG